MYIRKEIREFLKKMPKEMKLPKHWRKFINKHNTEYNLIIQHGESYECTNCGKYFYAKQVPQVKAWDICPFCKKKYDIKRSNLKNYFFLYDLAAIDNIDNKIVLRYFEIERKYNYHTRRFDNDVVEYARIVPELNIELVNDRFFKYMATERVYHTKKIKRWRVFTGTYGLGQYYKSIYLENLNEKIKGTVYQYAPIQEAITYLILKGKKIDLLDLMEKAKYSSFELLMKADLCQLALECPEKFEQKGNFEQRFGVKKEFYKFMFRHDISYKELQVLQLIKIGNMSIIQRLLKISNFNINDLKKASKYVNLLQIEEYSKKQKDFSIQSYLDYIRNLEKLEIPLNKKILFPESFEKAHDESVNKVKIVGNKFLNKKIQKRYKELQKNEFTDNIFFIRAAKSLEDMKSEAKQQKNCVYKNYSEDYAYGDTDIYFLRKLEKPEKSVVTVEVLNGEIRQKYQKKNTVVTTEQEKFLELWEKNVISKTA
ncbi:MAG: hypothetical protein HFJ29_00930 [Clostridia bacterium]|nr:hypothetical protein [Clostridia bacterium]